MTSTETADISACGAAGPQHTVPMPGRIAALPRNRAGYPIPFFTATVDGVPDIRVASTTAWRACVQGRRCWVCGHRRGGVDAYVLGPMCTINRTTQDPPSHPQCALYAVQVCPFLARPDMVRRENGLPDDRFTAGIAIDRNPGVAAVWSTTTWSTFRPDGGPGRLIEVGDPTEVSWWTRGRPATRDEVLAAFHTGLPLLEQQCSDDTDRVSLAAMLAAALRHLPPPPA